MAADWQEGKDGGRRPDARKVEVLPAALPQTEQEQRAAIDREFWTQMRDGLLLQIAAIEWRFHLAPRKEKPDR